MGYTQDLKILITGDEKQAADALTRIRGEMGKLDIQQTKSATGWDWNRREVMQMTTAMQGAAYSMGNTSGVGKVLTGAMGELNQRLAEFQGAIKSGTSNTAAFKGMIGGMVASGVIMAAAFAIEELGKHYRKMAEEAEKAASAAEKKVKDFTTATAASYRYLYESGQMSRERYMAYLEQSLQRELGAQDAIYRKNALIMTQREIQLRQEIDRIREDSAKKAVKVETDTAAKIRAVSYNTGLFYKRTLNDQLAALQSFSLQKQAMFIASANTEIQTDVAAGQNKLAVNWGVLGQLGSLFAQHTAAYKVAAAAQASIDTKAAAVAAYKALAGIPLVGPALGAAAAAAAIAFGMANVNKIMSQDTSAAFPTIPTGGVTAGGTAGGGGGGYGGGEYYTRGGESNAPISGGGPTTINLYQTIITNGNVMASDFYRRVLEASAAGARAGGR